MPLAIDRFTGEAVDVDLDGEVPVYDGGGWSGTLQLVDVHGDVVKAGDLYMTANPYFDVDCSLSYLREDMRRSWQFAVVLGGTFLFVSLAWAGVMYMQDSASGTDLSRSRTMMFRVLGGFIIVACAYILWELIGDNLLGHLQSWTGERDVFYRLRGGGRSKMTAIKAGVELGAGSGLVVLKWGSVLRV